MKFGATPIAEAERAILAHSVKTAEATFKKGRRLSCDDLAVLRKAGIGEVVTARLEEGDVHEDEAAERVARAIAGAGVSVEAPFTGRSNLHAEKAGLLLLRPNLIDRLNRIDAGLTVATLPPHASAEAGRMLATVKVIPFALPEDVVAKAESLAGEAGAALTLAPYRPLKVALVATELASLKPKVLDKTKAILEQRLEKAGASLTSERRVPHATGPLAEALAEAGREADLVIAFGASAITDAADVIPAAIEAAGGAVIHLGMPVDPGNLLLVGHIGERPVIGAPGCARSPKENGFDWVLNRFLAGLEVRSEDITGMGVGGLLMEIVSRPQPRQPEAGKGKVTAIVLAAGRSRRMGGPNKLLARFDGVPLVRRTVDAVQAAGTSETIVVTGHMREEIEAALAGACVSFVHNRDYAGGLAGSLKAGLRALPEETAGALIVLADMPGLTPEALDAMIEAFAPEEGRGIVLATASGKRGNPVLWARRYFPELMQVSGDAGGRHLIGEHAEDVSEVEIGEAARLDVDTPEALAAAGGKVDRG
ncbi:NTP transferase domain-containing protein [Afifella pfennigii]|uniref:NTP transferase domain-containing protein n=1 Tax=Afifella pfennigii TaxID=209897 RepID=UPI00047AA00D|nr:molybdopterin-binding/glycosyltransferase family 2 protein [Afifella pfennigii]